MAAQYIDHVTAGENQEDIKKGEGWILSEGLHKTAAYRDQHGKLHKMSANCPHLGACVRRNSVEKTWDCPAHGSRFDPKGKVLNGPACGNLKKE